MPHIMPGRPKAKVHLICHFETRFRQVWCNAGRRAKRFTNDPVATTCQSCLKAYSMVKAEQPWRFK